MSQFNNKTKQAVALKYNMNKNNAPVVIAAAQGPLARRIKEIAQKEKIPVYREESLAKARGGVNTGRARGSRSS